LFTTEHLQDLTARSMGHGWKIPKCPPHQKLRQWQLRTAQLITTRAVTSPPMLQICTKRDPATVQCRSSQIGKHRAEAASPEITAIASATAWS